MSQLQQIQDEILRRFQRPRRVMDERLPDGRTVNEAVIETSRRSSRISDPRDPSTFEIQPGYGKPKWEQWDKPIDGHTGEYISSPLNRPPVAPNTASNVQANPQMMTPRNQAAITRPRSVFAPPQPQPVQDQPQSYNPMAVLAPAQQPTFDGKPILAEQLNGELFGSRERRTQPRDFVADDEQFLRDLENKPRGWKDTTVDVLRALNSVWGSNPKAMTPTKREREIAQTQQRLKQGLTIDKADAVQARVDQGQQRIDLTAEQNEARRENWKSMDSDRRKKTIVAQYKAGMLNDPKSLEQAARELNIPGELQPAFIRGEMRDAFDVDGNLIEMNRRTGAVITGPKSYETVKEAGRERRAEASQAGATERTRMTQAGATQRAAARGTRGQATDRASARKAAELVGKIERARKAMEQAEDALTRDPNNTEAKQTLTNAQQAGEGWAAELNSLNAGYEAGAGEQSKGGYRYPYYKQKGTSQPTSQSAYAGRTMSQSNLQRYAKDKGLSIDQAKAEVEAQGVRVQ